MADTGIHMQAIPPPRLAPPAFHNHLGRQQGGGVVGGRACVCAGERRSRATKFQRDTHVQGIRAAKGYGRAMDQCEVQCQRMGLMQIGGGRRAALEEPPDARVSPHGASGVGGAILQRRAQQDAGEPRSLRHQRMRHHRRGAGRRVQPRTTAAQEHIDATVEILGVCRSGDRPSASTELQRARALGQIIPESPASAVARAAELDGTASAGTGGLGLGIHHQGRPGLLLERRPVCGLLPRYAPIHPRILKVQTGKPQ